MPGNSTGLVRIGLSGSKPLLISSVLCAKNSLDLPRRDSGEIYEGSNADLITADDRLIFNRWHDSALK